MGGMTRSPMDLVSAIFAKDFVGLCLGFGQCRGRVGFTRDHAFEGVDQELGDPSALEGR